MQSSLDVELLVSDTSIAFRGRQKAINLIKNDEEIYTRERAHLYAYPTSNIAGDSFMMSVDEWRDGRLL